MQPLYAANNVAEAASKAAENEKAIYDRAKSKTIYINLVANLIKNLRTQLVEKQSATTNTTKGASNSSPVSSLNNNATKMTSPSYSLNNTPAAGFSHEMILSGPKATRVNYSIGRAKSIGVQDLSGEIFKEVFI